VAVVGLTGRTALVTGAARGIGRAIALELAARGATVAVNDLPDNPAILETVAEIKRRGGNALAAPADTADGAQVKALIRDVVKHNGGLDILVNNAAVFREGFITRLREADWDAVMAVDLRGYYLCTRYGLRAMTGQDWGRVINIASVAGIIGGPGRSGYAAAKGGVIALTRSVAAEVGGYGITVNSVAPGYITTEMSAELSETVKEEIRRRLAIRRFGTPEDVAKTVAFLASTDADYITGQVIRVDGGVT